MYSNNTLSAHVHVVFSNSSTCNMVLGQVQAQYIVIFSNCVCGTQYGAGAGTELPVLTSGAVMNWERAVTGFLRLERTSRVKQNCRKCKPKHPKCGC